MDLSIAAIKFNHDPNSAAHDALTIRKNAYEGITIPEWETDKNGKSTSSPVAYIATTTQLKIAVKLRRSKGSKVKHVSVYAEGGGILGDVTQDTIDFNEGNEESDFKLFKLERASIAKKGIGRWPIEWKWYLVPNVGSAIDQSTKHVVYTLMSKPNCPWGQLDQPNCELPWSDVLEKACDWAAGAKDPTDVATKIAHEVYKLGPHKLQFDSADGAFPRFLINGTNSFDCQAFLNILNSKNTKPRKVNCTDCAVVVSSFANILGCDLYQSRLGDEFYTNLIQPIGIDKPYKDEFFTFHEVAWESPCTSSAKLYDACLQVDGDLDPTEDFDPMLPVNITLGDSKGTSYHFRLVRKCSEHCKAKPESMTRRRILRDMLVKIQTDPDLEQILMARYDFASWHDLTSRKAQSFFWRSPGSCYEFTLNDWQLERGRCFKGELGPPHITELLLSSASTMDLAVRVLIYQCRSNSEADSFLLTLLSEFQLLALQRRTQPQDDRNAVVGELAFTSPDDTVVLFKRGNVIVFVQLFGSVTIPLLDFAQHLDLTLFGTVIPNTDLSTEKEFQISDGGFQVRDEIPIASFIEINDNEDTFYKLVADSGEIFFRNDSLFYRPSSAGPQSITCFACKPRQKINRQVLFVSIGPTTTVRQPQPTLANVNEKEKHAMATDFTDKWSSIRPTGNPPNMEVDGEMDIRTHDPLTGAVTGYYTSNPDNDRTALAGYIRFAGGFYAVSLHHRIPSPGYSFLYEGQFIGEIGEIALIAGTFRKITTPSAEPSAHEEKANGAQNEGVWVATKP